VVFMHPRVVPQKLLQGELMLPKPMAPNAVMVPKGLKLPEGDTGWLLQQSQVLMDRGTTLRLHPCERCYTRRLAEW
jgi:hypothetical protein